MDFYLYPVHMSGNKVAGVVKYHNLLSNSTSYFMLTLSIHFKMFIYSTQGKGQGVRNFDFVLGEKNKFRIIFGKAVVVDFFSKDVGI